MAGAEYVPYLPSTGSGLLSFALTVAPGPHPLLWWLVGGGVAVVAAAAFVVVRLRSVFPLAVAGAVVVTAAAWLLMSDRPLSMPPSCDPYAQFGSEHVLCGEALR